MQVLPAALFIKMTNLEQSHVHQLGIGEWFMALLYSGILLSYKKERTTNMAKEKKNIKNMVSERTQKQNTCYGIPFVQFSRKGKTLGQKTTATHFPLPRAPDNHHFAFRFEEFNCFRWLIILYCILQNLLRE